MNTKLAIITGGTGYIGTAVTKELLSRGWEVAQLSRSSQEYACDVTNAASVSAAVAKAVNHFGHINAAIHAAAAPIERVTRTDATESDAEAQTLVAVCGAKNLYEAVLPHMLPEGAFIAITSDATKNAGELKMGNYVEAKRKMEVFIRGLHTPFQTMLYSAGFLPGGLNSDLPEQVKNFFAAKSKPVEQVAKEIADLCGGREVIF